MQLFMHKKLLKKQANDFYWVIMSSQMPGGRMLPPV